MTQGAPETGKEVGLMYSFSSPSDDGFSPAEAADEGRDLHKWKPRIINAFRILTTGPHNCLKIKQNGVEKNQQIKQETSPQQFGSVSDI